MNLTSITIPLLIFAGAIYFAYQREKKRREGMAAAAMRLGCEFIPAPSADLLPPRSSFVLLDCGHSRRSSNLLRTSRAGLEISIFDHRYTSGTGKHSHTRFQTAGLISLAGAEIPRFTMRPETFLDRLGEMAGFKDIDFPEYPEFSKAFRLNGEDEKALRRVFTPALIHQLERSPGLCLEGSGRQLLFYRSNHLLAPDEVSGFIDEVCRIAQMTALNEGK